MEKRVIYKELNKRIIAISDIHGHLDLFKALLAKVNFSSNDDLVIIGDYVEKGTQILELTHEIMALSKSGHTHVLNGNCEWAVLDMVYHSDHLKHYLNHAKNSIFHEVFRVHQIDYRAYNEMTLKILAQLLLKNELAFMEASATILQTPQYLFVHAGIENRHDFQNSTLSSLLEQRYFMQQQHPLSHYVIVGHLPVANYHSFHIDNNMIIDQNKRMIGIDGGVGVKKVCQLNALIIDDGFHQEFVRPFKTKLIIKAHYPGVTHHHKVTWPHYEVKIISSGDQFSECQKIHNQEMLMIKNEFLYQKEDKTYCEDDYIDFLLMVEIGDCIDLINIYDQYAYVIKGHEVGWIPKDCLENEL